jgi:molecular chaperone GrpE
MREEILQRFASYLDHALVEEEVPLEGGADAPEAGDLYAVWAELTAVTQEVKLQSRGFKQLHEAVTALLPLGARIDALEAQLLPAIRQAADQAGRAAREREAEIERRCQTESIDLLLDVRERLQRSVDALALTRESRTPTWRERLTRKIHTDPAPSLELLETFREGYMLSLERIDDLLDKHEVRRIDCLNTPFDALRMQVVALEVTDRAPEGTVLEVYRPGYERRGEIHRPAQVKVAKREG